MQKNWRIREYEDGDEEQILALFKSIFKKDKDLNHWNWEFKEAPKGSKMLVAVDDGKMVGHLGALLRKVKIGENMVEGALEVDGMTDPDYGRQGIFFSLGKELLSTLEKENDVDIQAGHFLFIGQGATFHPGKGE
jgi:hypothetical protein